MQKQYEDTGTYKYDKTYFGRTKEKQKSCKYMDKGISENKKEGEQKYNNNK